MDKYKAKEEATVVRQEEIAPDIYSLILKVDSAPAVRPGQFYTLFPKDGAHLLGRPISVCGVDKNAKTVRFVYQKKGSGTTEFSKLSSGDSIKVLGPLGNGFAVEAPGDNCLLIGGGMGVAPMLGLAKAIGKNATIVLGYRDEPFMNDEFEAIGCKVIIATDSGRVGHKGTVVDALKAEGIETGVCFSCGPMPMLKAVCEYGSEHGMETYVSLEERMGCGIGACLGCVTKAAQANDHYRVEKLCICKDGPVFKSTEVVL